MALNRLAQVAPTWLESHLPAAWYERYAERFNNWHLPKEIAQRQQLMLQIGADGYRLLDWLYSERQQLPQERLAEVEALRQIWIQQFWLNENDEVQVRDTQNMPKGAKQIASPFDLEARFSQEREGKAWLGYKTHLTETCAEHAPRILSHVQTVLATEHDSQAFLNIQTSLCAKGLQPQEHYLDMGYNSLTYLVASRAAGIEMYSPLRTLSHWQNQQATGLTIESFFIDWVAQKVQCPNGKFSRTWSSAHNEKQIPIIQIRFAEADCRVCPLKANCTQAKARSLKLYAREFHETLVQARAKQKDS